MISNWKESEVLPSPCPFCGNVFDRAISQEGQTPGPGDYSVCIYCASVLKYGENMELLAVPQEEINENATLDPEFESNIKKIQDSIRSIDRRS